MSLNGIWKGEIIEPGEENDTGKDEIASAILIINYHDRPGPLTGTLDFNPEEGIEESGKVVGEGNLHDISFVLMLSNYYYKNYKGQVKRSNCPHPDTLFDGKILRRDFMTGNWVINKTYRYINAVNRLLVDSPGLEGEVVLIPERKGSWWFKKVREHQNKE